MVQWNTSRARFTLFDNFGKLAAAWSHKQYIKLDPDLPLIPVSSPCYIFTIAP